MTPPIPLPSRLSASVPPAPVGSETSANDYAKCEAEIKALSDRVTALEQQVGSQDSDDAPQSDNPFSAVKSGGSY